MKLIECTPCILHPRLCHYRGRCGRMTRSLSTWPRRASEHNNDLFTMRSEPSTRLLLRQSGPTFTTIRLGFHPRVRQRVTHWITYSHDIKDATRMLGVENSSIIYGTDSYVNGGCMFGAKLSHANMRIYFFNKKNSGKCWLRDTNNYYHDM